MDDDGQRVERDGQFLDRTARLLHPDPFVEHDPTRGHRDVGRAFAERRQADSAASARDGDMGRGIFLRIVFGGFLGQRQQRVASLEFLGAGGGRQAERREQKGDLFQRHSHRFAAKVVRENERNFKRRLR